MQADQANGDTLIFALLFSLNLALGLGFAVPFIKTLSKILPPPKIHRSFLMLMGLYFIEIFFLAMGMGIPVFNVALALFWGLCLGRYLRTRIELRAALKISTWFAFYSSLPAMSFLLIPGIFLAGGANIISIKAASDMGIPSFLPWPTNTILGFYAACGLGALGLKILITNAFVKYLFRHKYKKARTQSS
jgi:hypothetical protein